MIYNFGLQTIEGEKVEQIVNDVISIFAQNNLNYDSSVCMLDIIKNRLGELCFIKDKEGEGDIE